MSLMNFNKKTGAGPSSRADRSGRFDSRPRPKSSCGPTTMPPEDLLSKEEQYKLMNAQLEAKTADIVKQADQLMREHNELLLADISDEEGPRIKPHECTVKDPSLEVGAIKEALTSTHGGKRKDQHSKTRSSEAPLGDDLAAAVGSPESFLANVIRGIEGKMGDVASIRDDEHNAAESRAPGMADARVHVWRAKLRIMQEELDHLSSEYHKKDDLNDKLGARIKELEDDGAKLQRTVNAQRAQIEKHKASADESSRRCDGLQLEASALKKEIEDLTKTRRQAAAGHNGTEVRLNRALEEVEKLKAQITNMKQANKDKISEEHQSREGLLAENRLLRRQKDELVQAFKKQLNLIDVLNRQKMHLEAAKLLSFQEDEFVKALDWGTP